MKEGINMPENHFIVLNRKQLYDEIWEISASGVSKKYEVPYAEVLKRCKENDIPIPSSGYWTKLRMGKPVEQISLPESNIIEVELSKDIASKRSKASSDDTKLVKDKQKTLKMEKESMVEVPDVSEEGQHSYNSLPGEHNTYKREKLYVEVWTKPVVEVATQYGVSDVMIHKICKSLNVPVPPRGYWAKLRAGEVMDKPPLPVTNGVKEKMGLRIFDSTKVSNTQTQFLPFLDESERQKVLIAAQLIQMPTPSTQLHKKIIAYKSKIKEWNKNDTKPAGAQRGYKNYSNQPPFLAGVISDETLPRVLCILDTLFCQIEILGGSINDDLSMQIRNEHVTIEVAETQDEIKHVITKQEAREILIYEDAKRHNKWASEPNIRKYDYVFNGRLRICIRKGRYFRDTEIVNIETRLGDMLIELYEESQVVRIDREAREEATRKREEEARLREERRDRYNTEIKRTIALTNAARDYETACSIRAYIAAIEAAGDQNLLDDETKAWVDWAKKKSDWFDPTVARNDELMGRREHEKNDEEKVLRKLGGYW